MHGWDYLVIHLNVENNTDGKSAKGSSNSTGDSQSTGSNRGIFSESFLRKEFPQFYEANSVGANPATPQHPAQQLQNFLNRQGGQGWDLIGVYPLAALLMMIFRRPKIPAPPAPEAIATTTDPTAAASSPTSSPASSNGGDGQSAASEELLANLVRRVEALEARLPAHPAEPETGVLQGPIGTEGAQSAAPTPTGPQPAQAPSQQLQGSPQRATKSAPAVLSPETMARLAHQVPIPASEAARALGLRSATSLANLGARHGYPPGLIKQGSQGLIAIYTGTGPALRGGNLRRLWIVVPAESLGPISGISISGVDEFQGPGAGQPET
jgi:hypothetical protein